MPLLRRGRMRKRWRYVGVYGEYVMLGAARVEVGPLRQSFWAIWDRECNRRHAHTRMLPGGGDIALEGDVLRLNTETVRAELRFGDGEPVEVVCPSGERGYGWTRKRAGIPVEGWFEDSERRWPVEARGMVDESAGYHQRHTSWLWSTGVGRTKDGRAVAWNLVEGINDPPERSERTIWVDGTPTEPAPVSFDGLEGIRFAEGAELRFASESERARNDNLLIFRSRYRHLFGSFSGSVPGLELNSGFGVMEQHDAVW
jgi:hypothetical protein